MNSSQFIDLEDSLSCSQGPATGPCPEPDECAPYTPTLCLTRALILCPYLCLGIPSGLFRLLSYVFSVCYMPLFIVLGLMILVTSDVLYKVLVMSLSPFPSTVFQYLVLSHLQSITITFCWNVTPCFGRCRCFEESCCSFRLQCNSFLP
jgi:hypothetical protein